MKNQSPRPAFSLLELIAVVGILGVLGTIIVTRVTSESDSSKISACHTYQGDIEIQVEIWRHNTGALPSASLADIGGDGNYFPEGLPSCPVDGSSYSIDPVTGFVIGHNH